MKPRDKYTDNQWAFLECLFSPEAGGDIRKAMTIAGYSDNTAVNSILSSLREEIAELTTLHIATAGPKAYMGILKVMNSPGDLGNKDLLSAAKEILDRGGFVKSSNDLTMKVPEGGLVILPMKNKRIVDDGDSERRLSDRDTLDTATVGTPSEI